MPRKRQGQFNTLARLLRINNAGMGNVPKVRNMMPIVRAENHLIELPYYVFAKTDGSVIMRTAMTGGTEVSQPMNGLEFTESPEYLQMSAYVQTARITGIGAAVNYTNQYNYGVLNNYMKWFYGPADTASYCKYDSTWFPLDYDKKIQQDYRSNLPNNTRDYKTYVTYTELANLIRDFNFRIVGEVNGVEATTLIGTITFKLYLQIKRRDVLEDLANLQQEKKKLQAEVDNLKAKVNILTGMP